MEKIQNWREKQNFLKIENLKKNLLPFFTFLCFLTIFNLSIKVSKFFKSVFEKILKKPNANFGKILKKEKIL